MWNKLSGKKKRKQGRQGRVGEKEKGREKEG